GGAALGNSRISITVTDKDVAGTVRFATSALTVVEGTTAVVTVLRTGGLAGGVRVPFSMFDGTTGGFSARNGLDFVLDSRAVVFEEGETTKTIAIPIFADALLEGPETFKLFLNTPSGGGTL